MILSALNVLGYALPIGNFIFLFSGLFCFLFLPFMSQLNKLYEASNMFLLFTLVSLISMKSFSSTCGSVLLIRSKREHVLQKLKTRVIKKDVNPEWNEDLTLSVTDPNHPIQLVKFFLSTAPCINMKYK